MPKAAGERSLKYYIYRIVGALTSSVTLIVEHDFCVLIAFIYLALFLASD